MKYNISVFEVTDDESLKDWGDKIMTSRKQEAMASLEQEKVEHEAMYSFQVDGRKFVIGLMVAEGDHIESADESLEINKEHREIFASVKKEKIKIQELYSLGK